MDSVITQVEGLNNVATLKTRHTLPLYTHYSLYTYKMALNTYAYIHAFRGKLTDSGDEKLVFESSEQVSVVRLAASCSVFIGRSGGAYHGYFCSFRL
jgi:hypothetical protein